MTAPPDVRALPVERGPIPPLILPVRHVPAAAAPSRKALEIVESRLPGDPGAGGCNGGRRGHPVERIPEAPLHGSGGKRDIGRAGRKRAPVPAPRLPGATCGKTPSVRLPAEPVNGLVRATGAAFRTRHRCRHRGIRACTPCSRRRGLAHAPGHALPMRRPEMAAGHRQS